MGERHFYAGRAGIGEVKRHSVDRAFGVNAAAVASRGEHARRVLASAGPVDDVLAAQAAGRRRTVGPGSRRTNVLRVRNWRSADAQWLRRGLLRAGPATGHSSRCGRTWRTGVGETTIHGVARTPHTRPRWARQWCRCLCDRSPNLQPHETCPKVFAGDRISPSVNRHHSSGPAAVRNSCSTSRSRSTATADAALLW